MNRCVALDTLTERDLLSLLKDKYEMEIDVLNEKLQSLRNRLRVVTGLISADYPDSPTITVPSNSQSSE
jgi:hypothetical protein